MPQIPSPSRLARPARPLLDAALRAQIVAALQTGEALAAIGRRLQLGRAVVRRVRDEAWPGDVTSTGMVLHVRVSRDEARAFAALCEAEAVTRSAKLRDLMRAATGFTVLDAATRGELEAARRELTAIGRNLNQIARAANSGRTVLRSAELAQVEAMFRAIQSFMLGLNGVLDAARRKTAARGL